MVGRVAAGCDLDAAARALGASRRRFDALWTTVAGALVRRARAEGALRCGRVGERERSLARLVADNLRGRGWEAVVRNGSIAATSRQGERLAVEAVGEGRWALEAAIGEARARAAGRAGIRPGIALNMPDVRGLRSLAETERRVVPAELVVVVVEGAYVQELTVASIAAPPARLPRDPFAGGYG